MPSHAPNPARRLIVPKGPPGFVAGARAFFGGFSLLFGTPRAYPLAAVPVLVAIALFMLFSLASVLLVRALVDRWLGGGGWWVAVVEVLASLVAVIVSVFTALALTQPASGPALEALVRVTERELGIPEHAPTSFFTDIARSAGSAFVSLTLGGIMFVILLFIGLIPGAALITVPLKFVVAVVLIGWDLCDYPLSVRGVGLGERIRFSAAHASAVIGFSAGMAVIALVPCGFLLMLPVGVAGATRLVAEIQGYEASARGRG